MASNNPENFHVIQNLGDLLGGQNDGILIVRCRATGQTCVEKKLGRECLQHKKYAYRERDVLRQLVNHDNIVYLLGDKIDPGLRFGSLFLNHCDGGSLSELIQRHHCQSKPIEERSMWVMLSMVAKGIEFMHHGSNTAPYPANWRPILHLDLKPSNVLLRRAPQRPLGFVLQIADFGLSQILQPGQDSFTVSAGTPGFRAPECPNLSFSSDVWSLGATFTCLCLLRQIPPEVQMSLPKYYTKALTSLIVNLGAPNPPDRPSSSSLVGLISNTAQPLWPILPRGDLPVLP